MKNKFSRVPFIYSFKSHDDFECPSDPLALVSDVGSAEIPYTDPIDLSSSEISSYKSSVELSPDMSYRDPVDPCQTTDYQQDSYSESHEVDRETKLPLYSLDEVSYHDSFDDCWIILYDRIYDVTSFLLEHPGGEDVLLEYAGRDATISFRSVGHSHQALKSLEQYLIGILPDHQRIFPSDSERRWTIL